MRVLLLIGAALFLGALYYAEVAGPNAHDNAILQRQILAGTAPAPYRHRILVPLVAARLGNPLTHTLCIAVTLLGLYAYLRAVASRDGRALVGALFVAATMPLAFRDHGYQPWSLLEPGLLALGLLVLHRRQAALYGLLAVVACLNRETGALLVLFALLAGERRCLLACALASVSVLVGLRVALGTAPTVTTAAACWAMNADPGRLLYSVERHALLMGPLYVLAALGWRRSPLVLRRLALGAPLYVLALAPLSHWWEVRLLWSLYPLLLPVAAHALTLRTATPAADAAGPRRAALPQEAPIRADR